MLPEGAALPPKASEVMSAGRVKHIVIQDIYALIAKLQWLIMSVTEKNVLLVLYSTLPLLTTKEVLSLRICCPFPVTLVKYL